MENQLKRVALLVEGINGLAHVILGALLREDLACQILLKNDGVEALDYLLCRGPYARRYSRTMPSVIFLDLALPHSDGLGMLREMRAHEQTRLLPVVVFCSAEDYPQADAVYASGANSYVDIRAGFEPFEESMRQVARYWCEVNEPPPPSL